MKLGRRGQIGKDCEARPSETRGSLVAVAHRVMEKSSWPCAGCQELSAKHRYPCKWESYCSVACKKKMWGKHKERCSVFLSKDIAAETEKHGHMSEEVVEKMMNLGNVFILQDRYPEAEKMLRQAEAIARQIVGDNDPLVASILQNIGMVLQQQDRLEEAVELFFTSLDINLELYGGESVKVASNLISLGSMFVIKGEHVLAREAFEKALQLYQTEEEEFPGEGNRLKRIACCLCSLGGVDDKMGNAESAEEKYATALEIRDGLPPGCPERESSSLMYKVNLLVREEKLGEALIHMTAALPILRSVHGARSPTMAKALLHLAQIYRKQGEFHKSLKAIRKAKKFRLLGVNDRDHVSVVEMDYDIALVLMDQRQYDEARMLLETVAVKYGSIRGNHFSVAQAHGKLARCLEELGDIKGALHEAEHSNFVYSKLGADWDEKAQKSALSVERLKVSWNTLGQPPYKYSSDIPCEMSGAGVLPV